MKRVDVVQGTHEWFMARLGIPTASHFGEILTPATLKLSKQARAYRYRLVAERFLGEPIQGPSTQFMDRGNTLEPEAIRQYEFENNCTVERVGLFLTEDLRVGASSDGLVGTKGIVEAKVFEAVHHVRELLSDHEIDNAHKAQIQGNLWITEREWCDRYYYHPEFTSVCVRMERDDTYIKALHAAIYEDGFLARLDEDIQRMTELGCVPQEPRERQDASDGSYTPDAGPSWDEAKTFAMRAIS